MSTNSKPCRGCGASIPVGVSQCSECGANQVRGGKVAIAIALFLVAVFLAGGLYQKINPPGPYAELDADVRYKLGAAQERRDRFMKAAAVMAPPKLRDVRQAPYRFEGQTLYCAERVEPKNPYSRVFIVHDVPIYDDPQEGPWFDYLWTKVGC